MNQRLMVYRRMAGVRREEELNRVMDEVRDRYGSPPDSVLNLAEYASIRLLAEQIGLESLDRDGQLVVLKFRQDAKLDPAWLYRVVQERGDLALVPPASLRLDLRSQPAARQPKLATGKPEAQRRQAPKKGGDPVAGGSWWAARAKAGEVTSGFTKAEIMRPAKEDPRSEGGLFARVGGLLRELSAGSSLN
jgi:hypothetical protein